MLQKVLIRETSVGRPQVYLLIADVFLVINLDFSCMNFLNTLDCQFDFASVPAISSPPSLLLDLSIE